ncbi:hypothetical protein [Pseudoalteromonas piscicida]|uniref:hypothetical protein n=1 Tax=Pseudoalteromonas piscicida TaxID=43662 RepID=UPI0005F9B296|nr:hypothetical protein [Pseudoalteromonas piscicida]KJY96737.1 hypothetical protein TW73_16000 [Pseudoalteromonas piscicida]
MFKKSYLCASIGIVMSMGVSASQIEETNDGVVGAAFQSGLINTPARPIDSGCCDYRYPSRPCLEPLSDQKVLTEAEVAESFNLLSAEPIYVGGARYQLTKSDMKPIYSFEPIYGPCPGNPPEYIRVLKGYEVELPVDGDFGQDLIYEVTGRASTSVSMSVSCGTGSSAFTLSDSGTKLIISKRLNTGGTCSKMHIKAKAARGALTSLDLTVAVYTPLQ